jgi:rhamnogalacturonyl hydrolase YesR
LLDSSAFPGPETTGTAAFTYATALAVNEGLVDAATFAPVATRAWAALSESTEGGIRHDT